MIKYTKHPIKSKSRIVFDEFPMWHEFHGFSLSVFWGFFYLWRSKGLFWFRIMNGYGLHGKLLKTHPLLFSERYGHAKTVKIFGWSFRILKP